jgi:predicted nucleic acid-binding protein
VVDTSVISTELDERLRGRRQEYERHLRGRSLLLSFQTVAELHYGALRAGWGELRTRRLQRLLTEQTRPVETDPKMAAIGARLRVDCERVGHGLAGKSTKATVGLLPPPSAWGCRSSPMTGSSLMYRTCS